jgi:hypothetical protein
MWAQAADIRDGTGAWGHEPAVAQKGRSSVAPGRLFRFSTISNASRNRLAHLPVQECSGLSKFK